ncbi:MAG: ABC transporter permease [Spirochaetaceae bacterium]|nr:MAG: ABC transporter permease [Spirochaetaceae bacterium]
MNYRKLFTIILQEFRMTAATKSFLIMTILGPFLIGAIAILPGVLAQRQSQPSGDTRVGIATESTDTFSQFDTFLADSPLNTVRFETEEQGRNAIADGEIQGVLVIPENFADAPILRYVSRTGTDMQVSAMLQAAAGTIVTNARIADAGLDPQRIAELTRTPAVRSVRLESGDDSSGADGFAILLTALTFVMLIYMTVLLYGQMIGRSVLTEKIVNTKEIMLSSVRPSELLFGKIFGKGAASLVQYGVWIGIAALIITVIGPRFDIALPTGLTAVNLGFLLVFFLLGFFLYSTAFAAIGSGAQDEQQFGQLSIPVIVFLIIPLVLVSPIVMNPEGALVLGLSHFPLTSPIVMLLRILVDRPVWWEILLSIALLLGAIALAGAGAARIFSVGILKGGKAGSWKEMISWIRQ